MSTPLAYLGVILIWSTTPLAIKWSNDSLTPYAAVSGRMLLAATAAAFVVAVAYPTAGLKWKNWRLYLSASFGLFPGMPMIYWAAQHIPSGLIAVIFGLSSLMTGLLSIVILRHNPYTPARVLALLLALIGVAIISLDQLSLGLMAGYGIAVVLVATLVMSLSTVLVKRLSVTVDAFEQTMGALFFSLPGLVISWWIMDGQLPEAISAKSWGGVLYLALIGSLLGFFAYFYILRNMSLAAVSLVPLITPMTALWVGAFVGGETLSTSTLGGTALIIAALLLHEAKQLRRPARH